MTDGPAPRPGSRLVSRPAPRPGSRLVAVLAVLVGAGLVVVSSGRPWAQVTVADLPGPDVVTADGQLVAPGATAVALVAAAGAVVLATSGRAVRLIVAALLVLAGGGVAAMGAAVLATPAAAVAPAVATATGTTGAPVPDGAHATAWPVVAGLGGLLVVGGGAVGLLRGRRWAGPSRRFERAGGTPAAVSATGTKGPGPATDGGAGRAPTTKDERLDAWDRLTHGEDPTD